MTVETNKPTCWILTDGKIGMVNQCLGLARALGVTPDLKTVDLRSPWKWLPPALNPPSLSTTTRDSSALEPPWPDLLIATGRRSIAPARAIRKASDGHTFCVQIQDPGISTSAFDMVIAPAHDRLRGDNVLSTLGALHGIDAASLDAARDTFAQRVSALPHPIAAVLLGGDNAVYRMTERIGEVLADQLHGLTQDKGWSLAITPSRRTPPDALDAIRAKLQGPNVDIWDEQDPNPYLGFLAHADAIIVTCDSVNMVSEAAATGKPIHVVSLEGGSEKFRRFHDAMTRHGVTRPFAGTLHSWEYDPPDDMAGVGGEIMRRMTAARGC